MRCYVSCDLKGMWESAVRVPPPDSKESEEQTEASPGMVLVRGGGARSRGALWVLLYVRWEGTGGFEHE